VSSALDSTSDSTVEKVVSDSSSVQVETISSSVTEVSEVEESVEVVVTVVSVVVVSSELEHSESLSQPQSLMVPVSSNSIEIPWAVV
jgi:hypothetical protein